MIDPFVLLTPVLILAVMALLRFVGCDTVFGIPYVVTPVNFEPPQGGYFNPQMVSLSQGQGAAISYTTSDTGSPDQPYTGPILVSANTTIRATATKEGENSGEQSAKYIIGPITFQQLAEFDDQTNVSPNPMAVTTAPFTGSIAQNTLMVVWIYYRGPDDGSITVSSVTDLGGNSYFPAVGPTPQGTEPPQLLGHRQEIYYAIIAKTDTGGMPFTVTANFTAPVTVDKAISAHAYIGAYPDAPFEDKAGDSGTSGNPISSGSVTTTNARLVFGAAVFVGGNGSAVVPEFRQRSTLSANVSEDKDVPMPGQTVAATFNNPGSVPWIAQMCTFK